MGMESNLTMPWHLYVQLAAAVSTSAGESDFKTRWNKYTAAAADYARDKLKSQPSFSKLSDISSGITTRLSGFAPLVSCARVEDLKQLQVQLTFASDTIVDVDYEYHDDTAFCEHVDLQLKPVYDIISGYLNTVEVGRRWFRPLELRLPAGLDGGKYFDVFDKLYTQDPVSGKYSRTGMPYAVAVFLTYTPF